MEVNSTVLKIIVRECCRSLSYSDEERQFSFSLRPSLHNVWESKKKSIWIYHPDFTLNDFNMVLSTVETPTETHNIIHFTSLMDKDLFNGEVLSIETSQTAIQIVRMKQGQYINIATGKGISFGDKFEFCIGKEVVTSEGSNFGICKAIAIYSPSILNIAMSRVFLGKYYLNKIGKSLWPIYDEAIEYLRSRDSNRLDNILRISANLGAGSFALLNILKGVCALTK